MIMKREVLVLAFLVAAALVYFLHSTRIIRVSVVFDSAKQRTDQLEMVNVSLTIDWSNPRYCTTTEDCTTACGSPFNLPSSYLKNLGIPLGNFVPIRREDLDDFVFVTAANKHYYHIAMDAIGNVQKFLPNYTIYFYDLEISLPQKDINKMKSLCNVIYRKFNYSRYPAHVQYLKNYSFKPLVVHEILAEFPRVFWIDSSIRFNSQNLSLTLDEVFKSGGILTFDYGGHSNFAATHKGMYQYLPISASAAAKTGQYGANSIYMHRTEEIYMRIIFWWVLCSLREDCMSPTHDLSCQFKGDNIWAKCHRFDQSALNILMAHHFLYNVSLYTSRHGQLDVRRSSSHKEILVLCPNGERVKSAVYVS